jgi:Chromo (CHRromatin Organisation MOdifier) domain
MFCGPFAITEKINDVTYSLDLSSPMLSRGIHNAFLENLLRPYHPDTAFDRTPVVPIPVQFPDGHNEYEVDKIVRYRLHRGKPQYLVHWKGYGDHENSWIPVVDLSCPELLADFHRAEDGSPTGGDDDRFYLSTAMYRHARYRDATFKLHLSFPHIDMPRIPLPCHPHRNT